jgi:putative FmdB family regulatory protein
MPIYAYKCGSCGHAKDVLQKLSDPPLAVCPVCGAAAFAKQVTAAGFQLKGSGWYATDFRNGSSGAPAKNDGDKSGDGAAKPADGSAKPADSVTKPADSGTKPAEGAKPAQSKPADSGPGPGKSGGPAASAHGGGASAGH